MEDSVVGLIFATGFITLLVLLTTGAFWLLEYATRARKRWKKERGSVLFVEAEDGVLELVVQFTHKPDEHYRALQVRIDSVYDFYRTDWVTVDGREASKSLIKRAKPALKQRQAAKRLEARKEQVRELFHPEEQI